MKPLHLDIAFSGQANVRYAKGYDIKSDQPNGKLIAEAVALAKTVDVIIAASSRDHLLFEDVVSATDIPISDILKQQSSPYYKPKKDRVPTKEAFEQLCGRLITVPLVSKKGSYHMNSTMEELRNSFLGNQFYRILMRITEEVINDMEEAQMGMI